MRSRVRQWLLVVLALVAAPAAAQTKLPNIVVLTAHNEQITHLRDYVNVLAAAAALGHDG